MVDYSRWDKWAEDVESSDDEGGSKPTVTKFDTSQSVTFGGGTQKILHRESSPVAAAPATSTTVPSQHSATSITDLRGSLAAKTQLTSATVASADRNVSPSTISTGSASAVATQPKVMMGEHTRNGGRTPRYHWAQSMDTVTCCVFVPAGTRGRYFLNTCIFSGERSRVGFFYELIRLLPIIILTDRQIAMLIVLPRSNSCPDKCVSLWTKDTFAWLWSPARGATWCWWTDYCAVPSDLRARRTTLTGK